MVPRVLEAGGVFPEAPRIDARPEAAGRRQVANFPILGQAVKSKGVFPTFPQGLQAITSIAPPLTRG
jgi:hypothetical protein